MNPKLDVRHQMGASQSTEVGHKRVSSPGALAVVLIHGIGDIIPGDVLDSSVTALEKHFGVKAVSASQTASGAQSFGVPGRATVRKAEVRWSGRQLRGLIKKRIIVSGFLETENDHPVIYVHHFKIDSEDATQAANLQGG